MTWIASCWWLDEIVDKNSCQFIIALVKWFYQRKQCWCAITESLNYDRCLSNDHWYSYHILSSDSSRCAKQFRPIVPIDQIQANILWKCWHVFLHLETNCNLPNLALPRFVSTQAQDPIITSVFVARKRIGQALFKSNKTSMSIAHISLCGSCRHAGDALDAYAHACCVLLIV